MAAVHLERPVFVTGSPRTGTTLMQHCLARDPQVYRLERESRYIWHRMGAYERTGAFPSRAEIERNYIFELFRDPRPMSAVDVRRWVMRAISQGTSSGYWDIGAELRAELSALDPPDAVGPFARTEQDETAPFCIPPASCEWALDAEGPVRMADKDTGHCWRLPQLAAEFDDAVFVFMLRNAAAAITSLVNAWLHPTWFFTYRVEQELRVTGYSDRFEWGRHWWNVNLFPGWEELLDAPLHILCARQWEAAILPMLAHGEELVAAGRATYVSYDALVARPQEVLAGVAELAGLDVAAIAGRGLDQHFMSPEASTRLVRKDDAIIAEAVADVSATVARIARLGA